MSLLLRNAVSFWTLLNKNAFEHQPAICHPSRKSKTTPKTHIHAPSDTEPNEHIAFYTLLSQRTNFIYGYWERIAPQPFDYRQQSHMRPLWAILFGSDCVNGITNCEYKFIWIIDHVFDVRIRSNQIVRFSLKIMRRAPVSFVSSCSRKVIALVVHFHLMLD